jgi:hypothetical protein
LPFFSSIPNCIIVEKKSFTLWWWICGIFYMGNMKWRAPCISRIQCLFSAPAQQHYFV